jgi:Exo-beta-D-glucosaminidase Ig-fold domain
VEDFERKAQMLNYVQHRAIFEGMNAHLWAPNTGRMLWMTQPAWPSSTWQILSSDYDTQSSYYAVKKASETLHVQLDPTTFHVQVANSLPDTAVGLTARAKVYSLDNKVLIEQEARKDVPSGTTQVFTLGLAPQLKDNVVLVKLELRNASGNLVSDNFYWLGSDTAEYRKLNRIPMAQLVIAATGRREKTGVRVHVHLENTGNSAAIETKLTLLQSDGATRILPAFYGDNYFSLLPGESREVEIEAPASNAGAVLSLRGWNVPERLFKISNEK